MIENIVIGNVDKIILHHLFAYNEVDWQTNEIHNTLFTEERYLPKVLEQAIGVKAKEIRNNRKDLNIVLEHQDFINVTYGKNKNKRTVYIAIGE